MDRNALALAFCAVFSVALRKESVDRNTSVVSSAGMMGKSLSARRAWIEMALIRYLVNTYHVALRKESVDRNSITRTRMPIGCGRSPQGERG